MMDYRVGIGHDVHRLVSGRPLMLGGIQVPHTHGLAGHSDADVVLHAICDAMLGAGGLGDLGEHFPDTDAQYEGAKSSIFLKKVSQKVHNAGWTVENVDVTILAEEPKLQEYKQKMKRHIARELNVQPHQINIKAGTNEGLGTIGAHQAIAAWAVVLLKSRDKG